MRNIEALKNYFLGKDPQLKETMADNSLRLCGIKGENYVLRPELMRKLKLLRDELVKKDQELADKVDEAVAEMEKVAASIPFTMLDSDLHIYQNQPMDPSWESGWYNTGEYKVYFADTVEPIAFEHTLFYYNNAPGETYLEFMPETFVDSWNLLKLFLYWDEDEQEWFSDSIGIDDYIGENSSGIPTSSAVRYYVQNNVIHHLQAPVAAASDLSQGLYVADSDLRLVTAYEQVQLNSGDFIVAQASTSTPGEVNLIIIQSDKIKTGTYSTMDGHLTTTDFGFNETIPSLKSDIIVDYDEPITTLTEGVYYAGSHKLQIGSAQYYGLFQYEEVGYNGFPTIVFYPGAGANAIQSIKYFDTNEQDWKTVNITKTTILNSSSTNNQLPGAKAVYNATLHTYSTTEKRVGTWIDGKPAYELTIIDDALSLSGGYGTLATTVANVENVCSSECYVGSPNTAGWRQGYLNSNYYSGLQCSINSDNDLTMTIYAKEAVNPIKAKVIVRYTKTTD